MGFEGGQMPLYRRIARRGFSNHPFKTHFTTVDVGALEAFSEGEAVNRQSLIDKKIVRPRVGLIKILGNGSLSKRLAVDVDKVTAGARKAIEAAGGKVVGAAAEAADKPAGKQVPAKQSQGAKVSGPRKKGAAAAKTKRAVEAADGGSEKPAAEPRNVDAEDAGEEKER
jgi:hypothetical protein